MPVSTGLVWHAARSGKTWHPERPQDPELLRQAFTAGSDIVSRMLADNLMGRRTPQNVPGIQQWFAFALVDKKMGSRRSPSLVERCLTIRRR